MARLFGKKMSRREIMQRVGDLSQIARITEYRYESGKAEGMRGYEVVNGSGLVFTVIPSRCMDISYASYKGIPISFISKSGITSPAYFEKDGLGFLKGFTCGLTTTCGLTYMGAPCEDMGEKLGLHGRISNIPAQNCSATTEWIEDNLVFSIKGQMRESEMFGTNMVLNREISTMLGSNEIRIHDVIVNEGFEDFPLMLLYHCNFGYPLVDDDMKLDIKSNVIKARDARAEEGIQNWNVIHGPQQGFTEQLYYFDTEQDLSGYSQVTLQNNKLLSNGLKVVLKYSGKTLPYCSEWKQLGMGDYVLGIEPATWLPEGRAKARERGELLHLKAGDTYETDLIFTIEEL